MGVIPEIPELKDVLTGDLKEHGRWLVASVNARMSWTLTVQKVLFRGAELWVLPVTKEHYPGVALNRPASMAREAAERVLMQFCSSLGWIENGGVLVEHMTENRWVMPMGRQQSFGYSVQSDFDFSYLPEPEQEKGRLALAIMREARALNHPAYAFLSFYRVLEVAFEDGRVRGAWMTEQAAQSLGLSTRAANSSYRCFLALEQMKGDEEFGEYAEPKMYSYFEEVFRRANLRTWLEWSDEKERFCSEERLHEFYGWMTPQGEENVTKLPEAKSVRELSNILADENALNALRSPEGTLSRAIARFEVDHPEDWYPKVLTATAAIKSLTPDTLRNLDPPTLLSLQDLRQRIDQAIKDRDSLLTAQ